MVHNEEKHSEGDYTLYWLNVDFNRYLTLLRSYKVKSVRVDGGYCNLAAPRDCLELRGGISALCQARLFGDTLREPMWTCVEMDVSKLGSLCVHRLTTRSCTVGLSFA